MNDISVITLTGKRGGFTLVDNANFARLNRKRWQLDKKGYVRRCTSPGKNGATRMTIHLGRAVLNAPDGIEVDHRNGYPIDNTRRNLRLCTRAQNKANARMQCNAKTSVYKGVSWHNQGQKWRASITVNGKRVDLGLHPDEREAALAYNAKATELFGEFARLNDI